MRVLIFGSRTFGNHRPVYDVLSGLLMRVVDDWDDEGLVVIEGCASGADDKACRWYNPEHRLGFSTSHHRVHHEHYPAEWTGPCRDECSHGLRRRRRDGAFYCPAAGNYRNEQMLREGKPDVAWGFVDKPLELSTGSLDMATRLKEAEVETYIVQKF